MYAEEKKMPPDFPKVPEGDVKVAPPPENSAQVIVATPNVLAVVEIMKKMTYIEFISFGALALDLALALGVFVWSCVPCLAS